MIDYYSSLDEAIEVLVVEQDTQPRFPVSWKDRICYVFVKNSGLFNRSWVFNVGARMATHSVLAFADGDIVMHPEDFLKGVQLLRHVPVVNPYSAILDLTEVLTNRIVNDEILPAAIQPDSLSLPRTGINLAGGILLMQKNSWEKMGGWPEEVRGWGVEDNIMEIKILREFAVSTLEATAFHLHHPPAAQKYHPFEEVNRMLLKNYASGEISSVTSSIGNPHRYTGLAGKFRDVLYRVRYRKQIASYYHYAMLNGGHWLKSGLTALLYNPFSLSVLRDISRRLIKSS